MEAQLIAAGLLTLLELYKTHHGKGAEWVPTPEDWAKLRAEVEVSTIERLHEDARLRNQTTE